MKEIFVGIDLGGTNIKIGCFDSQLNLISKTSIPTNAEMGPGAVVDRIAVTIEEMLAQTQISTEAITAIGIALKTINILVNMSRWRRRKAAPTQAAKKSISILMPLHASTTPSLAFVNTMTLPSATAGIPNVCSVKTLTLVPML